MYTIKIEKGLDNNPAAKQIRTHVFIEEQGFKDEFDDIDPVAHHLVIFKGEKPLATGRVFPKGDGSDTYIIGRIAVEKDSRKLQLGRLLMEQLEKIAKDMGGKSIYLSAQMQAKGFYEKVGYQDVGEMHYEEFCPHIGMEKKL